jgi:hypothetical protein
VLACYVASHIVSAVANASNIHTTAMRAAADTAPLLVCRRCRWRLSVTWLLRGW